MQFRDYSDYEQEANKVRSENGLLLDGFEAWLAETGLKEKTINKHIGNVAFYINEYLLYEDVVRPQEGLSAINEFFNWFFPRKAMWSSVSTTKETVASLKKFYRYLADRALIEQTDYEELVAETKSEMPSWLEHYNDLEEW